jgi:hypothetical protein
LALWGSGGIACQLLPIINNAIEGNSAGTEEDFCIGSSDYHTLHNNKNNGGEFGGGVYMVSKSSPQYQAAW